MPLSVRAQAFLASLRRHPAVPVARVAAAIREAGCTPYDIWLDFHERYAGYHEPLGKDAAIYGIVHTDSYWLGPGKASVRKGTDGNYSVICAEVHGTYDFRLHQDGRFTSYGGGGPCETFDVNVEQHSLVWEVKKDGRIWPGRAHTMSADGLNAFRAAVGAEPVAEASDRFTSVWKGREVIVFERLDPSRPLYLWAAKDSYERIKVLLKTEY